jgi:hypothetical protein
LLLSSLKNCIRIISVAPAVLLRETKQQGAVVQEIPELTVLT